MVGGLELGSWSCGLQSAGIDTAAHCAASGGLLLKESAGY